MTHLLGQILAKDNSVTGPYSEVIPWDGLTSSAEKYASLGLSIFPLGNIDTASGLTLRFAEWKTEASKNLETISAWWRQYPNAGIGLPVGKATQIIAFEVDYQHGGFSQSVFVPLPCYRFEARSELCGVLPACLLS